MANLYETLYQVHACSDWHSAQSQMRCTAVLHSAVCSAELPGYSLSVEPTLPVKDRLTHSSEYADVYEAHELVRWLPLDRQLLEREGVLCRMLCICNSCAAAAVLGKAVAMQCSTFAFNCATFRISFSLSV